MMDDVVRLKSAFVNAAYAKLNSSIIRCSADIVDGVLIMQFLLKSDRTEEDLDDVRDIIGDIIGLSPELYGREELFYVNNIQGLEEISPRRIPLFRVPDRCVVSIS